MNRRITIIQFSDLHNQNYQSDLFCETFASKVTAKFVG